MKKIVNRRLILSAIIGTLFNGGASFNAIGMDSLSDQERAIQEVNKMIKKSYMTGHGNNPFKKKDLNQKRARTEEVPNPEGEMSLSLTEIELLKAANTVGTNILEEGKYDRPRASYVATLAGTENGTPVAIGHDIDLELLLKKTVAWDEHINDPIIKNGFQYLWGLTSFLPVRRLTVDTKVILQLWSLEEKKNYIDPTAIFRAQMDEVDRSICQYTEHQNNAYSVMNLALNAHIPDALPGLSTAIRNLRNAIIYQQTAEKNKFNGIVYRGSRHSALEIINMAYKRLFYFPSFISASTSESHCYWDPIISEYRGGKHNVKFAIDLSEFPDHSVLIRPDQSPYNEQECLLACYNLYEWQGCAYTEQDKTFWVHLKVKDPNLAPEFKGETQEVQDAYKEFIRHYGAGRASEKNMTVDRLFQEVKVSVGGLYRKINRATSLGKDDNTYFDINTVCLNEKLDPWSDCMYVPNRSIKK